MTKITPDFFTSPMGNPTDEALAYLADAIDALTLEGFIVDAVTGAETPMQPIELCVSIELERMDGALRFNSDKPTMLKPIAEEVKRALIAVMQAKQALERRAG